MTDSSQEPEQTHVGITAAASMLGVSPNTVRRMLAEGRLPFTRTSEPRGKILIPLASIRELGGSTGAPDVPKDES